MPVLKHAKKKLRQDKKRTLRNKSVRSLYRSLVKKANLNPTTKSISVAFKSIDKAAKNNIIHTNKAAHMKSALSKLTSGKVAVSTPKKAAKKPAKKTIAKKKTTSAKKAK